MKVYDLFILKSSAALTFAFLVLSPTATPAAEVTDPEKITGFYSSSDTRYLPSYNGPRAEPIAGRAQFSWTKKGTSRASIATYGLEPEETYQVRMHALTCADFDGGPALQDPACSDNPDYEENQSGNCESNDTNELWLTLQTDSTGRGIDEVAVDWTPPEKSVRNGDLARGFSFVVYDTPNNGGSGHGERMACVSVGVHKVLRDFKDQIRRARYCIDPGFARPDSDGNVPELKQGRLLVSKKGTSKALVQWTNLRSRFTYPSKITSAPCAFDDGGPAYTKDISFAKDGTGAVPATADTEFWVGFKTKRNGKGKGAARFKALARADAISVVLYDCLDASGQADYSGVCGGGTPALACCDFR